MTDSRELSIQLVGGFSTDEIAELSRQLAPARFGALLLPWSEHARSCHPEQLALYYYIVRHGDQVVGLATLHVIERLDIASFLGTRLRKLGGWMEGIGVSPPGLRVGFLEIPLMNLPGLVLLPAWERARDAVRARIVEHARGRLGMHALCVKLSPATLGSHARRVGLLRMSVLDNAVLPIAGFADYQAYLAHLSWKRRQNIRRSRAKLARSGAGIERLPMSRAPAGTLFRLFANVADNAHRTGRIPLTLRIGELFFARLPTLDRLAHVSVIRQRGEIACFLLVLRAGGTRYFKYYGAEHGRARPLDGYFNLLQHELEAAIDDGCQLVDLGATSYAYKRRMGCSFEPTEYGIDVYQPLLRPLVGLVARRLEQARDR